jgi:hemolysin III
MAEKKKSTTKQKKQVNKQVNKTQKSIKSSKKQIIKENENLPIKKERISLHKYTLGEELISAISHGVGTLLAITALVLCIVKGAQHGAVNVVSGVIYGVSLIMLYTMSTLYHSFKPNRAKKVFRVFDHCSIFLLIAGSYTPFTLITLNGTNGWIMFAVIWTCAITGIVFNSINLEKFDKISFILYLIMGWTVLFDIKSLIANLDPTGLKLLVIGGITYTVGAIVYLIGNKVKYMHSVWHFFVLGGSIFQFFCILLYVL